ncbi:MAG: four helix bundle protein [Nitrospirota bacterium]
MGIGFEGLEVWKEGCNISIEIYGVTNRGAFTKDFGLRDQIRRCAVSIPSNIAEGKERETVKELIRYLYIAKGSAAELKTQLFIAYKIGYLVEQKYKDLSDNTIRISGMLGKFIKTLKDKECGESGKGAKCGKSE